MGKVFADAIKLKILRLEGHPQFYSRFSSVAQSYPTHISPATLWTTAPQASLSITSSRSLLKLMSIESVMPSYYLILCRPLLLPSTFPSIRVFSNESVFHIRWPKHWSFSISPSNEYSGQISFRIDWLDLLDPRNSQDPSSPAFNLSQHQGLFHRVGCSHRVAEVLELQHQSFQ